ncbi:MAG: adenosylmethionine decarboxylase [Pseudomonadota bacterium]
MKVANLFQLGMDLEAGTTHAEEAGKSRHLTVLEGGLFDEARADHFIRRDGRVFAGTHLIIEVVDGEGLDDEERIERALRDCVAECGATLLHIHTHKFSPQGVSGVAVLAESHISVHTWPEIGYGAFDVFMCGDAEPWKAVDVLREAFSARDVRVKELLRGEGLVAARL